MKTIILLTLFLSQISFADEEKQEFQQKMQAHQRVIKCSEVVETFSESFSKYVRDGQDANNKLHVINQLSELSDLYEVSFARLNEMFQVDNLETIDQLESKLAVTNVEFIEAVNSLEFANVNNKSNQTSQEINERIVGFQTMFEIMDVTAAKCSGLGLDFKSIQKDINSWKDVYVALDKQVLQMAQDNRLYVLVSLDAFKARLQQTLKEVHTIEIANIETMIAEVDMAETLKTELERFKEYWVSDQGEDKILTSNSYYGSLDQATHTLESMTNFESIVEASNLDSLSQTMLSNQIAFYKNKIVHALNDAKDKDPIIVAQNIHDSLDGMSTPKCEKQKLKLLESLNQVIEKTSPPTELRDLEYKAHQLERGCS